MYYLNSEMPIVNASYTPNSSIWLDNMLATKINLTGFALIAY